MKVLVVGTRDWDNAESLHGELNLIYDKWVTKNVSHPPIVTDFFEVIHGRSAMGADAIVESWARDKRRDDSYVTHWAYMGGPSLRRVDVMVVASKCDRWRDLARLVRARRRRISIIVLPHADNAWTEEDMVMERLQSSCDRLGKPYPSHLVGHLDNRDRLGFRWVN